MRGLSYPATVLVLCSCAAPDVTSELTQVNAVFDESAAALSSVVAPIAKAEFTAAEEQLIAQRAPVVGQSGICDPQFARTTGRSMADCTLDSYADDSLADSETINAAQVQSAITAMDAYWAALAELAAAETTAEVATATSALQATLVSATEIGTAPAFANAAQRAADRGPAVFGALQFGVEQYRARQLRNVMRRADPVIADITDGIAAWANVTLNPAPNPYTRFRDAIRALELARTDGTQDGYRAAIKEARDAHRALQTFAANDPVNRLWLLRNAHGDILARLDDPTADEWLTTFEQIKALRALSKEGA
ncbi:hypothetical protein [Yoonia sp. SDW83-1]|uniref:hypothetical protein n=1 Tax=Yoonia sp. SDW83-1 TaxID=3366945 RepID=UPI00398C690D